jgi:hypothetical protein
VGAGGTSASRGRSGARRLRAGLREEIALAVAETDVDFPTVSALDDDDGLMRRPDASAGHTSLYERARPSRSQRLARATKEIR